MSNDVKMIVIACNTVSSTCLGELREAHPGLPILGIISPAARAVADICGPENRIGIIGTRATVRSGAYQRKILSLNGALDTSQMACPALVPLIEEGIVENEIMDLTIRHYLDRFISYNRVDTLVLGCTHYPLIRKNIQRLFPGLRIIDPSEEALHSVDDALRRRGLHASGGGGDHVFYASDLSESFVGMINHIFEGTNLGVVFKLARPI